MTKTPSFKIAVVIVSLYELCLFMPTIDITATYDIKVFSTLLSFSLAGLVFPIIYPLADSVTEVYGKKDILLSGG